MSAHGKSFRQQRGVTLVELMISMAISLVVLLALVRVFVGTSSANSELSKTNYLIEDGRVAMRVLTEEIVHTGFWGGYLPHFDDLTFADIPTDVPTAIPNPCQIFSTWDSTYRNNALGVPLEVRDTLPSGAGCLSPLTKRAGTDVLIVRHTDTCLPGTGNCEADVAGNLYFQFPTCEQEKYETAQGGTFNTITFNTPAAATANAYVGATLRTTGGAGSNQYRVVSGYTAGRVATVNSNWTTTPDTTTTFAIEYVLGTVAHPLRKRDCVTVAEKRRFVSNIYYVSDVVENGESIPTLVRSQLEYAGGTLAHQAPVSLISGVESFRVVVGIDDVSKSGAAVDYTAAIAWTDAATRTTATNRGDGAPDRFIRCTTAAPCTAATLTNVVAAKLFVLTRSKEKTPGYLENKTYCMSEPQADGTCAAADTVGAFSDGYKRQLFTTNVRLTNISGRRDTP